MRPAPELPRRAAQVAGLASFVLAGGILSSCAPASSGLTVAMRDSLRIQIAERGLDPDTIVLPFHATEEMRRWVREQVRTGGEPDLRLQQLLQALLHREGAELTYQRGVTATAEEVWRTHQANCLSFTHLYVGLAREIGLPVYYLRVSDLQSFEKDGDLVVATSGRGIWILDDLTVVRQWRDELAAADLHLFVPRPAVRWRRGDGWSEEAAASNPPRGAVLHYWLKEKAPGPVRLEIRDGAGRLVRELSSVPEAAPYPEDDPDEPTVAVECGARDTSSVPSSRRAISRITSETPCPTSAAAQWTTALPPSASTTRAVAKSSKPSE